MIEEMCGKWLFLMMRRVETITSYTFENCHKMLIG
jgi:hypothetical protein